MNSAQWLNEVPELLVVLAHRGRPDWTEADHRNYMVWQQQFGAQYDAALLSLNAPLARCESPIERQFLAAMVTSESSGGVYDVDSMGFRSPRGQAERASDLLVQVQPTVTVKRRQLRPDFGLGLRYADDPARVHWVYVECDGHDYHSSKKDLARDKSRDRLVATLDLHVLRFTGTEIWQNPGKCTDEALSVLHAIAEGRSAA